jgi:hypothetical protein
MLAARENCDWNYGETAMTGTKAKQMVVTIFGQKHLRNDWFFDFEGNRFTEFLSGLAGEMERLGVRLTVERNRDAVITIDSYADLLNVVKISSPQDGHSNQCVGHIIGRSQHRDILEDITTAVRRVAFAPETIAPSSEFRKVCHNCGCGC